MYFVTGDSYRGFFLEDKMDGDGVYEWVDGISDVSCFKFDKIVGPGMRWSSDKTTGWPLIDGEVESNPLAFGESLDILLDDDLSNGERVFFRALCGCAERAHTEIAEVEAYQALAAEFQQLGTEVTGACDCGAMQNVIDTVREGSVSVQRLGLFKLQQIQVLESMGIRFIDQFVRAGKINGENMVKAFYKLCAIEQHEEQSDLAFQITEEQ